MRGQLHAIFVHFSIALTAASFGFDLGGVLWNVPSLAAAGWWTLAAAGGLTVGTAATGVIARIGLPVAEGRARSYLRAHMALGPMFLGALLAITAWRAGLWTDREVVPWSYLIGLAGLELLMAAQGYIGGELVYRFGLNVERRYRPLPVDQPGAAPQYDGAPPATGGSPVSGSAVS